MIKKCLAVSLWGTACLAQTLRITEPKGGIVVNPGQTLTVMVDASPALTFREIIIIGQDPIGFSQSLFAPPYRFSIAIPPNTRPRRYNLTANGYTEPGRVANSEPVEILVERSDKPLSLTAEPSVLDFQYVGDQTRLAAVGRFIGSERVDLYESSYVRYVSSDPRVATVTRDGLVTATGAGSVKIAIRYNEKSTAVPVIVRKASAGR
jgi:hypothetical protein